MPHSKSGVLRCVAMALALLCLAGQFSSSTHWVLVQHRTCPDHGELVHAEADHAPTLSETSTDIGVHQRLDAPSGNHGHDHCIVSFLRREAVAPPELDETPVAAPRQDRARHIRNDVPVQIVSRFLIAPKNSPPV